MVSTTIFVGNRYGASTAYYAEGYGARTSSNFETLSSLGVVLESDIGKGFTYDSGGFFETGTISETYFFSGNGFLTASITGQKLDVATRNSMLSGGESSSAFYQYLYRGNDHFLGKDGNDALTGSSGRDAFDGGKGIDIVDFSAYDGEVIVNLAKNYAETSSGKSTVKNVEDIGGSVHADTLIGDAKDNQIQGFSGNDDIRGGAGRDTAVFLDASSYVRVDLDSGLTDGGAGNDKLSSIERVIGSRYDDVMWGSKGDDTFVGAGGDDQFDGRGGSDTVEYSYAGSGVTIDLESGTSSGGGGADYFINVENVIGSIFGDTLLGSVGANAIKGQDGDDRIDGGKGVDILTGGAGADRFIFDDGDTGGTLKKADRITDFAHGEKDRIDLKGIDAVDGGKDSAFKFIGSRAFTGHAGELHFQTSDGHTIISGDTDGDKVADFMIQLDSKATLVVGDFVL